MRRVVVTGLGLVSPLGSTAEALFEALMARQSGVRLSQLPPGALPTRYAAEARGFTGAVEDFGPLEGDQKKSLRKGLKVMCRESQMGVAAAQLALHDAGLGPAGYDPERAGVVYGSDYMVTIPTEFTAPIQECVRPDGRFDFARWAPDGIGKMNPLWLLKYLPNMPASHIAIYNDMRGPNNSITHREAAANLAVGEAYRVILRDHADLMVAGSTGTRIHPMKALHALLCEQLANGDEAPERAARPFDLNRTGMVLGEGAGAIVLEELESARARGATIYAELIGAASSSVADRNLVAKRDVAMANAMRGALKDAGLAARDVGHLHAHGLATPGCDIDEWHAIRAVFGPDAERIPVTAAKSYFGNLGAGSGLIELIASILALQHGQLFGILNYETPDPACPIAAVGAQPADPGDTFLNLSVTPQGQASCVAVRRVSSMA